MLIFNTSLLWFAEARIELLVKFSCFTTCSFSQLTCIQSGLFLIPLAFPFKNSLLLDSVYQTTTTTTTKLFIITHHSIYCCFNLLQKEQPTLKWNNTLQNKDLELIQLFTVRRQIRNSSESMCSSSLAIHFNVEQINKSEDLLGGGGGVEK